MHSRYFARPSRSSSFLGRRLRWRAYAVLGLLVFLGVVAFFPVSGLAAAFQARDQAELLRGELSLLNPIDFLQVDTYRSLAERFDKLERTAGRARSRLGFLEWFFWVPSVGGRVEEANRQLDLAYFLSRSGRNLAIAYQSALDAPLDRMDAEEASRQVTEALQKEAPRLLRVEEDLERVRRLGRAGLDGPYVSLLDSYLPQIQAITYLSRVSPQVFGQIYVLNREISSIRAWATDPLQVVANPEDVDASLAVVVDRAQKIAAALEMAQLSAEVDATKPVQPEVLEAIGSMQQGVALLEHSTAGSRALLALTRFMEEDGLFSEDFGKNAKVALDDAETRLALAQQAAAALRSRAAQDNVSLDALSTALLGGGNGGSATRLEGVLEQASQSTQFLKAFLGFHGPRTYLLLGQNQQEIRASGGFIGMAVRVTLDEGELVELVYHDSTTVDALPPEYTNNPLPPDPLYWYLWMGRLLFRDANWSPNFPSAAAQVADIYQLGQGGQIDGVITGSKALMVDVVGLLGDVRVPDLPDPLTRESVRAYVDGDLPYQCSPRHVSTRGKRCFDEDLFFAVQERLVSPISGQERAEVVGLFKAALGRHNILIHVFDPVEGSLLWELGWNGAIPPVDHDYLLVVDSSLPGHTTEFVQRSWDYQVSLQLGRPANARLRLRYNHQGLRQRDRTCRQAEPAKYNCYWNYFRVYLPGLATGFSVPPIPLHQGSEKLIWGYLEPDSGSLTRSSDVGPARLVEFGGFISVEPGSVMTIPLEYQLPWETVRSTGPDSFEYRLLIQKQPGIDRDLVRVSVELPAEAELLEANPEPTLRKGRWIGFDFELDTDKQVVVAFKAQGLRVR